MGPQVVRLMGVRAYEAGAEGSVRWETQQGGCDPVVGTPAPECLELCSSGVRQWAPPLVGEGSALPVGGRAGGLLSSGLCGHVLCGWRCGYSVLDLGGLSCWADHRCRGGRDFCGELVQVAVGGEVSARRESVEGMDADTLCSLSPVEEPDKRLICEKVHGKAVLQYFQGFLILHCASVNCEGDFKIFSSH